VWEIFTPEQKNFDLIAYGIADEQRPRWRRPPLRKAVASQASTAANPRRNSYQVPPFAGKLSFSIACITSSTLSRTSEWPFSSSTFD
jgi:hypothetical protein